MGTNTRFLGAPYSSYIVVFGADRKPLIPALDRHHNNLCMGGVDSCHNKRWRRSPNINVKTARAPPDFILETLKAWSCVFLEMHFWRSLS